MLERIIKFTPNFFTLSNLSCGVIALVFIVNHHPIPATILVFVAAFCDLFDGKVARKLKVDSEFGVELDSLSDVVSFGVVPALMVYETVPHHMISNFVLILFPIGGALRLARFNSRPTSGFFEGLPITAAGLITSGLLWFESIYWLVPYIALLLAILMVSKIRVKKF